MSSSSLGVGVSGRARGFRAVMVDNSGLLLHEGLVMAVALRSDRIRVAERGSSRVWKNTQAGGFISANRRAASAGTRCRAKRFAAMPESAFKE